MIFSFYVTEWGAWNPETPDKASWLAQTVFPFIGESSVSPDLPQVKKMQKRRFSRLTKLMLSAAYDCVDHLHYPAVFASRHGELNRTVKLLKDIVTKDSLSPTAFSQSVHKHWQWTIQYSARQ